MSDEKKIEKRLGDAMENYRVQPPAAAKDNIRQKLREKELLKRSGGRGYLRYFIIAGVIAALIPAGMLLNRSLKQKGENITMVSSESVSTDSSRPQDLAKGNDSKTIETKPEVNTKPDDSMTIVEEENASEINNTPIKQKPAGEKTASLSDIDQKVSTTAKQKAEAAPGAFTPSQNNKSTFNSTTSLSKNKQSTFPSVPSSGKTIQNNLPSEPGEVDDIASTAKTPPVSTDDIASTAKAPTTSTENQSRQESAQSNIDNKSKEQITDSINQKTNLNENTPTPSITENHDNKNAFAEAIDSANALAKAPISDNNVESIPSQDTSVTNSEDSTAKNTTPIDTLSKKSASDPLKLSLDIYAGPLFNSTNYDVSSQLYFDEVKGSETLQTSFAAGLGVNIQLNRFIFSTGIASTGLKTKFSAAESSFTVDTSGSHYNYHDTTIMTVDSTGDTTTTTIHIDSTWISQHDTSVTQTSVSASNSISYISIPFMIGYVFPVGKFDFEIRAGASVAILNKVEATLISPGTGDIENYDSKSNSPFRKSYWSFIASLAVNYNFSNRLSVFLQPAVKYGLNSIYKADYPLTKKMRTNSICLGLRLHF